MTWHRRNRQTRQCRARSSRRRIQRQAGEYVNAIEKLRDPSHGRCLSTDEWITALQKAGFTLLHQETALKAMEFDDWTKRMQVSPEDTARLRAMILQAPTAVREFLTPQLLGDRITFHLSEAIFIAQRT